MKFILLITSIAILVSCKKDPEPIDPREKCPNSGMMNYGIENINSDNNPFSKDSIQIIEVNGMSVINKDTVRLNSFCDVRLKVKISSGATLSNIFINSDNAGNWLLDKTGLAGNQTFEFFSGNLNGFAYTLDKLSFKFYYNSLNNYEESKSILFIREK